VHGFTLFSPAVISLTAWLNETNAMHRCQLAGQLYALNRKSRLGGKKDSFLNSKRVGLNSDLRNWDRLTI